MSNPIDKNTSDKKRSHSSQQMPREVRLKRSESDTSLGMQDPTDLDRQTLQREGCVEIDIPLDLQKKIDAVNALLEKNKSQHKIDTNKGEKPTEYTENFDTTEKERQAINSLCSDLQKFSVHKLEDIFPDKTINIAEEMSMLVRNNNNANNLFHKDKKLNDIQSRHVTILLPMVDQQGTLYVPHQHKHQYPENNINSHEEYDAYLFPKKTIKKEHIQQANPKKIFMFLCRRASEELGEDFDNKSLIHAVPNSDHTINPRIYIGGRFGVVDTQDNNPQSQS